MAPPPISLIVFVKVLDPFNFVNITHVNSK